MNKIIAVVILVTSFIGCKKEDSNPSDSWKTEKFKTDYTIQFPGYYIGGFIQGFEGGTFNKTKDDTRAVFSYAFTNGLQYFDFGDTLFNINTDTVWVKEGDLLILLPNRLEISTDGITTSILYYNEVWSISMGELYVKDGGVYKDALTVHFANDLKEEMISILETIRHN